MARITSSFFLDQDDKPVTSPIQITRRWQEFDFAFIELKSPVDGETYRFRLLGERQLDNDRFVYLCLPAALSDGNTDDLMVYKFVDNNIVTSVGKDQLSLTARLWND